MKVKVLIPFHDVDNFAKEYSKDEVMEFDEGRAARLTQLGIVEPYTEPAKAVEVKEEPKKTPKRRKTK